MKTTNNTFFMMLTILWIATLFCTDASATLKKITVNDGYAGARCEASDDSLDAWARIVADKDTWWEVPPQTPGVECKAEAKVKGHAPDNYAHYGGYYTIYADTYKVSGNKNTPKAKAWEGKISYWKTKSEASSKRVGVDLDTVSYYNHLSGSSASARITGDYPENSLQHTDTSGAEAEAAASQFSVEEATQWDCYNCDTPQCSKCGGSDDDDDDDENPIVSPTPTPTPTDGTPNCPDCTSHCLSPCLCSNSGTCNGTVSYHACGEHETTVSGDHSLQASCTSTDANGNSCTVTNFYACDNHSHVYPVSPPPTPTPTPSPPSVVCGGAPWTGCTASVSSRTEHKVDPCSNCGNHYWTCKSGAVDRHTNVKTCKRSGCGASLTRCQNGPGLCVNGGYHWL